MFSDGVRMQGLEVLAKQRIAEGLPLCLSLIEPDRWGANNRFKGCMKALRIYGGAARGHLPDLREMQADFEKQGKKKADWLKELAKTIEAIEAADEAGALVPLPAPE